MAFGDQLEEARESRGLSLDDLAEATRVARHHLVALEKGDIAALPAGPFARGYIEACARVLDVDAAPILEAYRAEAQKRGLGTPEAQDRMLDELTQIVKRRSGSVGDPEPGAVPWKGLGLALCAVVLLAIGGWLVLRSDTPDEPPAMPPHPTSPAVPAPSTGVPTAPGAGEASATAPYAEPHRGAATSAREEPTPAPEAPRPNPNITISEFGVGTGVENHRLIGAGDEFPERSEAVFWTRVDGGEPGNVIHHVWLHEGRGIARVPLAIGGSHWRTFSRRPLPGGATGRWTVEARGLDGRLLARQEFDCVARARPD